MAMPRDVLLFILLLSAIWIPFYIVGMIYQIRDLCNIVCLLLWYVVYIFSKWYGTD